MALPAEKISPLTDNKGPWNPWQLELARVLELDLVPGPEILDIYDERDIGRAVAVAARGQLIACAGGTVYGLGGLPEAFREIGIIKGKDFRASGAVALATWETMERTIAWEKLASGQEEQENLQRTIRALFDQGPIHIVAPIRDNEETQRIFPFTLEGRLAGGDVVRTQAFMCADTLPEMNGFVRRFEEETGRVFHVTTANLHGESPCTSTAEIEEKLGGVETILRSPALDEGRPTVGVRDELLGCSYTMIEITGWPGSIRFLRQGTHWPDNLAGAFSFNGMRPELDLSLLEESGRVLTSNPEIITIPPIR